MKLFNLSKRRAEKYHEQGRVLSDEGKDAEAIEKYLAAIKLDPKKSESYYNIGLIYKYRKEWQLSFDYNQKANALDPDDESARWNLAIAATALRRWDVARSAWKQGGMKITGTTGPINMDFGATPVRLNPDGDGEVVWARRIDPVRARIENVPYVASGFKHGDVVLHDGAAVGHRKREGREYPVFNVLELFESSAYETSVATVELAREEDLQELQDIFSRTEHEFEDWTTSVKPLCRQCSEGSPHDHHDEELESEWIPHRTLGLALHNNQSATHLFDEWQQKTAARLISLDKE